RCLSQRSRAITFGDWSCSCSTLRLDADTPPAIQRRKPQKRESRKQSPAFLASSRQARCWKRPHQKFCLTSRLDSSPVCVALRLSAWTGAKSTLTAAKLKRRRKNQSQKSQTDSSLFSRICTNG